MRHLSENVKCGTVTKDRFGDIREASLGPMQNEPLAYL